MGLAIVLVFALVGFGHLLSPDSIPVSPYSDFVAQHIATKDVGRHAVLEGRFPWWRSDQLSGTPAATNPNSAYSYPLHVAFLLLPAERAYGLVLFLHFLLAGLAAWLAAKDLRLGFAARLFAAASWMFGAKLILAAFAGWLPVIPSICILPLVLTTFERVSEAPSTSLALRLALLFAFAFHGGPPQLAYYAGLFGASHAALAGSLLADRRGRLPHTLGMIALGAALGAGLSAYLLIPLAADAGLIARGAGSYEFFKSGIVFEPATLLTLLDPEILGTPLDRTYPRVELWEHEAYFGRASLFLLLAGLALRDRRVSVLAAGLVLSTLLCFDSAVLRLLHDFVPGFKLFRGPARFSFLAAAFGALAGASALDTLEHLLSRRSTGLLSHARARALVLAIPVAFPLFEGVLLARRYLEPVPLDAARPDLAWARSLDRSHPFRVAPIDRSTFNYAWAEGAGLELVTGYDPIVLGHYQRLIRLTAFGSSGEAKSGNWVSLKQVRRFDALDALNVKYLLSPTPVELPEGRFALRATHPSEPRFFLYSEPSRGQLLIYERARPRARAWVASHVVPASDEDSMFGMLENVDLDRADVAVGPGAGTSTMGGDVRVIRSAPGLLELEVTAKATQLLVISEVWHPGWRATLDGEELPIVRVDGALFGVWLERDARGAHFVARFKPPWIEAGLVMSLVSAAVAAGLWARVRRMRSKTG